MSRLIKRSLLCTTLLTMTAFAALANDPPAAAPSATGSSAGLTPMDQRLGTQQDEEITRQIREQLMARKNLSLSAQNVKIITLDRKVNLIGEVISEGEKNVVIQIAKSVAGNNVRQEIVVRK